MNWIAATILGGLGVSLAANIIVHLIFKVTGGHMDDGDELLEALREQREKEA